MLVPLAGYVGVFGAGAALPAGTLRLGVGRVFGALQLFLGHVVLRVSAGPRSVAVGFAFPSGAVQYGKLGSAGPLAPEGGLHVFLFLVLSAQGFIVRVGASVFQGLKDLELVGADGDEVRVVLLGLGEGATHAGRGADRADVVGFDLACLLVGLLLGESGEVEFPIRVFRSGDASGDGGRVGIFRAPEVEVHREVTLRARGRGLVHVSSFRRGW